MSKLAILSDRQISTRIGELASKTNRTEAETLELARALLEEDRRGLTRRPSKPGGIPPVVVRHRYRTNDTKVWEVPLYALENAATLGRYLAGVAYGHGWSLTIVGAEAELSRLGASLDGDGTWWIELARGASRVRYPCKVTSA